MIVRMQSQSHSGAACCRSDRILVPVENFRMLAAGFYVPHELRVV
jgi:hypothetical protein